MKRGCLSIVCIFAFVAFLAGFFKWYTTCIVLMAITLAIAGIVYLLDDFSKSLKEEEKPDDGTKCGDYVYFDYESRPGCWAHNDTLYSLAIVRTDNIVVSDWSELNTDNGWEVDKANDSEPTGSCSEYIERIESRKNGLTFHYDFYWRDRCWWYGKHDLVRVLFDKKYFESILQLAERGDAESQALIGCCYGHNGTMALNVVNHDIEKALYWWNKAAENGFTPAMVELALYYWHLDEKEKAKEWNEKSGRKVFIINCHYKQVEPFIHSQD